VKIRTKVCDIILPRKKTKSTLKFTFYGFLHLIKTKYALRKKYLDGCGKMFIIKKEESVKSASSDLSSAW
jgi:hypothetical protein